MKSTQHLLADVCGALGLILLLKDPTRPLVVGLLLLAVDPTRSLVVGLSLLAVGLVLLVLAWKRRRR